jgi:hypothetical protein
MLPYATASKLTPGDFAVRDRLDAVIEACLNAQLASKATVLVCPYVHIDGDIGWVDAQLAIWAAVARWRGSTRIALPIAATVAIGWRLLARDRWPGALSPLVAALQDLSPDEVLFAASKVDDGKTSPARLADLLVVIDTLAQRWPVTVLRQGTLGEACVAGGATGYETGIGWDERCSLRDNMASHRVEPAGHPAGRPKYMPVLGQSLAPKTLGAALTDPRVGAALTCLDRSCCPGGRAALEGDLRVHAIRARTSRLAELASADHPRWAWRKLAEDASAGYQLVQRINILAARHGVNQARTQALAAVAVVARQRGQSARRRGRAA